jgi:ribosomal protein S18 acetylase RimI-like enzyme
MERPGLDRDLPDSPPMPDGLELRPANRDNAWTIWQADMEAFRDHWGGFDGSEASFRRWIESPEYQPDLLLIAWDGDEVAGGVINAIYAEENAALGMRRGWLDSVFTRRPWRRRGLAKALIARSLHLLREKGMDTAALGVDADNPSGALGLYESFGFEVVERGSAWRRPLEADR